MFRHLWEERGLLTSKGKTLARESLITCLPEVVNLPKSGAMMYIRGHQAGYLEKTIGDSLADEKTRKVTLLPELCKILPLLRVTQSLPKKLSFPPKELEIGKKGIIS